MSTFEGRRTIDGLVVTKDGTPLDPHYEIERFTNWGFEWTYEGASPQQLALALLWEHLGDKDRAIRLVRAVHAQGGGEPRQRLAAERRRYRQGRGRHRRGTVRRRPALAADMLP